MRAKQNAKTSHSSFFLHDYWYVLALFSLFIMIPCIILMRLCPAASNDYTHTQMHNKTETEITYKHTDSDTNPFTQTLRHRQTFRHSDTNTKTQTQTHTLRHRQTDRQRDTQTQTQTLRHKQIDSDTNT